MKHTEKKRKNILDAAVEEFKVYGFEGARMTRISESASVSSRTLYKHYPNKKALFEEVVEIIIAETGAINSDPYDPNAPVETQLIKALDDYLRAIMDERYLRLTRMAMTEYLRDPDLARRVFSRVEMSNNPVRSIVSGAIGHGYITNVDLDYATEMLTAGIRVLFFWPNFIVGDARFQDKDIALRDSVSMFLMLYGSSSTLAVER